MQKNDKNMIKNNNPEQGNLKLKKKAPSFFRKKYTQKNLEAKVYKKIFVPADKTYVQSLIVETGKIGKKNIPVYGIPKDKLFTKKDFKHLKTIAKQIKKQKGRVRLLPFAAVAIFLVVLVTTFSLTKNIVIKKVIKTSCENIFEARCDIAKVDFKFFGASLFIKDFEIANKSAPMKDLIYIDSIDLDFDLIQALRARLVANELSVNGVETGKDRAYDGTLPPKELKKLKKKKAKQEKTEKKDSALSLELQKRLNAAKNSTVDSVTGLFTQYDPQSIIQNCYNSLQSPVLAPKVQETVEDFINRYQNKPAELEKLYNETKASVENLIYYDYSSILTDPAKIAEMVKLFDSAIKTVQNVVDNSQSLVNEIKNDSDQVMNLSNEIYLALQHDTQFASSEINKIKSFNLKDTGMSFITDLFNNAMYQFMGSYYPYYQKLSQKLIEMKDSASKKPVSEKQKAKEKKKGITRASGRDVIYREDAVPTLWIKKIAGSGTNFSFTATDITNNMNKLNKTTNANVNLSLFNIDHHCDLVLDLRETSDDALLTVAYSGNNYPFNLDSSVFGGGPGSPSFKAKTQVTAEFKAFADEGFLLSGKGLFENLVIESKPFEPLYAYDIYNGVMTQIKSMDLNANIGFMADKGLTVNLTSDVNKQFVNALTNEMNKQLNSIKEKALSELKAKITEYSQVALDNIENFDAIKGQVEYYINMLKDLENQLKNMQSTIQNSSKEMLDKAMKEAQARVEEELKKAQAQAEAELKAAQEKAEAEMKAAQEKAEAELKAAQEKAEAELRAKQAQAEEEARRKAEQAMNEARAKAEEEAKKQAGNLFKSFF